MSQKIYFDMDGVIANFDKGVEDFCGFNPGKQGVRNDKKTEDLWKAIAAVPHFYRNLDPIPEGMRLFDLLYKKYPDQIEILTAVPKPERGVLHADPDKREWCKQYLPDIPVNITLRREKKALAKPNDILIDDFIVNIKQWEKAGGTGLYFKGYDDACEQLKTLGLL